MNEHAALLNPAATDNLPFFITAPGQSDVLFNAMVVFLIVFVFAIGLLYLRLHALPEHLAHGASKVQMQLVCVLALLAMFTSYHIFWIAALLLALVRLPNFSAPLNSMAQSLGKLADRAPTGALASTQAAEVTDWEAAPARTAAHAQQPSPRRPFPKK